MSNTIALVGLGRISKRHIEAIAANPRLKIVQVCDVKKEKAQKAALALNCPFCTDYKTIRGAEIISVLTPSGMHPLHAQEIANATDCRYIVVEKPIALHGNEADALFDGVAKAGKTLLPVFQNRYNPLVVFLKELVASGRLGRVYSFVCNVLWSRDANYFADDWHGTLAVDGGVLFTQASHYIDMVHFLFGQLQSYTGKGANERGYEIYDTHSMSLHFKNGVIGSINSTISVYRQNYMTEFTLMAEKGTIRLSGTNLNKVEFWDVEGMEKPNKDFAIDHIYGKGHDTMYQYILDGSFEMFPKREEVVSGIRLMEDLSFQVLTKR